MTKTDHTCHLKNHCMKYIQNNIVYLLFPSLAMHCANINSIYGISPLMDWKRLWDENKIND